MTYISQFLSAAVELLFIPLCNFGKICTAAVSNNYNTINIASSPLR